MDSRDPIPSSDVTPAITDAQGSRLLRALHTPISDLPRGHVTVRHDARGAIDSAGLPLPIAELTLQIVRQARLWRNERFDVARELASHFREGLEAGRSADELLATFGNARIAAQLIRKAKLRNRPWWWRSWRFGLRLAAVSLMTGIVCYAILTARFYWGSPVIARNFTREINAARRVPKSEAAWPIYERASALLGKESPDDRNWDVAQPGTPGWPKLVNKVRQNAEALALARAAATRPNLGALLDTGGVENPELFNVLLDYCQRMRSLSRLLLADARVAAEAGEGQRAYDDVTAAIALAEHIFQPDVTLVEQLVGFALFTSALDTSGRILADDPKLFSEQQLRDLAHRIAVSRAGTQALDLTAERMLFDDVLQRVYTDNGSGDGRVTADGLRLLADSDLTALRNFQSILGVRKTFAPAAYLASPGMAALIGGRQENRQLYESLLDATVRAHQGPPWRWNTREIERLHRQIADLNNHPLERIRYLSVVLMAPAIHHCFNAVERTIQYRDAAEVAIALEIWHQRHGDWPKTLAELVPGLLPEVPPDRLDGKPLRYAIRDGRPVVYSLGMDRDDDGGRGIEPGSYDVNSIGFGPPSADWLKLFQEPADDGDWILWPPPLDPEEAVGLQDRPSDASAEPSNATTPASQSAPSK